MKNLSVKKIDWRWVGLSFCIFVVFHLLPAYFFTIMALTTRYVAHYTYLSALWLLLGIAIVGAYIGYFSRGVTIIEPALAALFYLIVISYALENLWDIPYYITGFGKVMVLITAVIIAALGGSAVGELLQQRKEQKIKQVSGI